MSGITETAQRYPIEEYIFHNHKDSNVGFGAGLINRCDL